MTMVRMILPPPQLLVIPLTQPLRDYSIQRHVHEISIDLSLK